MHVFARSLLYADVPQCYIFQMKKWQGRNMEDLSMGNLMLVHQKPWAGCIPSVHLLESSFTSTCSCMLCVAHRPSKITEGIICATFKEACLKRGLLEDDKLWHSCLAEAVNFASSKKLRELFAIMLTDMLQIGRASCRERV